MKKICSKCDEEKDIELFSKNSKNKDGRHAWCKECFKDYERERYQNGDRARKEKNKAAQVERARDFIWNYLSSNPCVDCPESDPVVLEFDHRDGVEKRFNVAEAYDRYSIANIKLEIEKCDVRCANCHRRRTARQFGLWRIQRDTMPL